MKNLIALLAGLFVVGSSAALAADESIASKAETKTKTTEKKPKKEKKASKKTTEKTSESATTTNQ